MSLGRWTKLALLLVVVVWLAVAARYRVHGEGGGAWGNTVNGDGHGYHGMLVGLFLHGNPAAAPIRAGFFTPAGQGHAIKYTCGAPLMQAPFFLLAHGIAFLRGTSDPTGLSIEYQFGALVGAITWSLLGLLLIARIGSRAGIADPVIAFTLVLIALGTGLMYYAIITPAMAHAYGFAAVSWCCYEAQGVWQQRKGALVRLAFALALAVLVRPTLVLIVPMLAVVAVLAQGRWQHLANARSIVQATLAGLAVLMLQPLLWKLQSGAWLVDGYASEGFNWRDPRMWSVLFGARKGFFFYWPALLLLLPALAWALWQRPRPMMPVLLGLLAMAYVTSAWWNWYYGHGYGMRALVDVLPVCALLIMAWFAAIGSQARNVAMLCASPLIALQLFQSWQHEKGILHPFNMDREKYALSFLRTDTRIGQRFGNGYIAELYAPHGWDTVASVSLSADSTLHLSGSWQHTPALRLSGDRLPAGRELYANIEFSRRSIDPFASDSAFVVFTYSTEGIQRMHETFAMNDIRGLDDTQWRQWRHAFNMPKAEAGDEVAIYLWQPGHGRIELRDLRVTLRAVRNQ